MKISRAQFKKILKECITELIDDGAFNKVVRENVQSVASRPVANDMVSPAAQAPQVFDSGVGNATPNERLRNLARAAAQAGGKGDNQQTQMLESIFADTAATTLQHQLGFERTGNDTSMYTGEADQPEVAEYDKASLEALSNGHGDNHWAAIAFGSYNKK